MVNGENGEMSEYFELFVAIAMKNPENDPVEIDLESIYPRSL
jgi:hypothetical protein